MSNKRNTSKTLQNCGCPVWMIHSDIYAFAGSQYVVLYLPYICLCHYLLKDLPITFGPIWEKYPFGINACRFVYWFFTSFCSHRTWSTSWKWTGFDQQVFSFFQEHIIFAEGNFVEYNWFDASLGMMEVLYDKRKTIIPIRSWWAPL